MMRSTLRFVLVVTAVGTSCVFPAALVAQVKSAPQRAISIDTYGLANQRLTAEAEFCSRPGPNVSFRCRLTTGVTATFQRHPRPGGPTASTQHAELEGFIRVRDSGLTGPWVGLRPGLTFAERQGFSLNLGVEAGVSRLIAQRIYAGASVGVRRGILPYQISDLRSNPAFRVAVGYAF
jgi:hypothetical protein